MVPGVGLAGRNDRSFHTRSGRSRLAGQADIVDMDHPGPSLASVQPQILQVWLLSPLRQRRTDRLPDDMIKCSHGYH